MPWRHVCGSGSVALPLLIQERDGDVWLISSPWSLTSEEIVPGTQLRGGWVGPKVGKDMEKRKSCSFRGSKPGRPARRPSLCRLSYPDPLISALSVRNAPQYFYEDKSSFPCSEKNPPLDPIQSLSTQPYFFKINVKIKIICPHA
jgi:hypothetical protein